MNSTPAPQGHLYVTDNGGIFNHIEAPSRPWQRLCQVKVPQALIAAGISEIWENDRYGVTVRRFAKGFFIKNSPYVKLGIMNADQSAHHDWRDFQAIKNDICGRDWEGIELYPAESRLMDPSNEFFMWCVPKGILKFGLKGGRRVLGPDEAVAPQRPFPPSQHPGPEVP